jgi:hypothetical protein
VPINLQDKYKIEDITVAFSGEIGRVPSHVRMVGKPLKIKVINRLFPKSGNANPNEKNPGAETKSTPNDGIDSIGFIKDSKGKIRKIVAEKETYIIEVDNGENITQYLPEFMPDDFKEHGLEIHFSGIVGKVKGDGVTLGRPFEIKEMSEITEEKQETAVEKEESKNAPSINEVDSIGFINETKASVVKLFEDQEVYILEVEGHDYQRFLPVVLPKEYKINGLQIIVSGIIGRTPSNARLVGTPFEIKTIKLHQ